MKSIVHSLLISGLVIASASPACAQAKKSNGADTEREANQAAAGIAPLLEQNTVSPETHAQDLHVAVDRSAERMEGGQICTTDNLIYAEVGSKITSHVKKSIKMLEPGAQLRDVAKLDLPCGFHLDSRFTSNLILDNGAETRRYVENNPFGFAPAFGFGEEMTKSYALNYQRVADGELHGDDCVAKLKEILPGIDQCNSFGDPQSFFGTTVDGLRTRLSHYTIREGKADEDFPVAEIEGHVESIFFLPPPDAPGGTITLIVVDEAGTYRAFLDTPKG